ncbi:hypothetical protein [Kitasatospora sp. NPDC004272]
MSARPFARRSRLLSAITLAVATGAAVLTPATAFAGTSADTPSAASSAPAATPSATSSAPSDPAATPSATSSASSDPAAAKPLTAKLSAPSEITPLTRGGSTESMTLTVTNDSDQAQPFHPEVLVTPTGPALTMDDPYSFSAQAIDAPPTWGLATWSENQSGGWVLPDHGMPSSQFTVPAHQTYTWSVSVGATARLAAADSALTFTLANDADNSTNLGSVTIPITPITNPDPAAAKPLTAKLSAPSEITPLTRGGSTESMTLTVTNDSDQAQPFHPEVLVTPTGPALTMDDPYSFSAQAIDAPPTWGLATWSENQSGGWVLPDHGMPSSQFTVPAHQTYTWSVSVGATARLAAADSALTFTLANDADNSTNLGSVTIPITPITNPDPAGSSTGQGSSATKPAGAAVPAALVAPVAGAPVAATLTNDTTTPAAHNLASTGGGSSALPLVGAGGAMVVLGAGAILYSQRRRAAQG